MKRWGYLKWKARDERLFLRDDYARQLVQLGQQFNHEGLNEAIEAVGARMALLAQDPETEPNETGPKLSAALANARSAVQGSDLNAAHYAYLQLRKAARDYIENARHEFPSEGVLFFTNPRIPGGIWNVNVPVTGRTNPPAGDLYRKPSPNPAAKPQALIGDRLGGGAIRGVDLIWEGDKVLLSWWRKPRTGEAPYGWDTQKNAGLYELDLNSNQFTEITHEPGYNDIEPVFLPDGSYLFASDRSSFGNQCAGPILQNKRCTTLFRLDPKRGDQPIAISNNKDFDRHPHVLNDGSIAFLHWEYQERGLYASHNVWRCRPDGTKMDAYYKQHISSPFSIRDVQQVPGSPLHIATTQGHHDAQNGPVILFNPSLGVNNEDAMWMVTPGCSSIEGGLGPLQDQIVEEGGVINAGGSFINPFPMSEKAFLAGHDMHGNESEFSIYYCDLWGNRELLHRDRDLSCFQPHPLRARERPPVIPDLVKPEVNYAVAFLHNVYEDLPGVEKGAVKYLRVSQSLMLPAPVFEAGDGDMGYNHLHYLPGDATARHFGHWAWTPSRTIGLVDVEPDGSAYFKVPAGTPIYLQALDENFCEVRRMRSSFTLQRGEFRSCTGCHETRLQTTNSTRALSQALRARGPQHPVEPSWGDDVILDFREHIQPILDRNCTSCHGQQNPAGGIELTSREIGGFAQSYRTLFGLKPNDPTPIKELDWHLVANPAAKGDDYVTKRDADRIFRQMQTNTWPGQLIMISDRMDDASITQPLQFGSNRSPLIRTIVDNPSYHQGLREKLTDEEWRMLVTWVDYNAIYNSTLLDVREFKETKTFKRVKYDLPPVWERPADRYPSFENLASYDESTVIESIR